MGKWDSDINIQRTYIQTGTTIYAADAGSSDTYAITLSPIPKEYTTGMMVTFKANTANTGAATLNCNSLGAKTIKKNNDQDLATGDIEASQFVTVVYDGTYFQMQSQSAQGIEVGDSPTFVNLTITAFAANWTNAGNTVADLGTVTTVDINGGTVDGATVGANSASTIKGTTIDATTDFTLIGTTGGLVRKFYEATANITAAASVTITLNIPTTAVILGCQLRVDSALATGELWDAAYSGGSTETIATAQAVAANTKVNSFVTDITDNTTNIAITKNGGGSFTAQGTIRAIVYAEVFDAMASL